MNNRQEFLNGFFKSISNCNYALLKFIYGSIDAIPETSDIDLLIKSEDINRIIDRIREGSNIEWVHFYKKSFVTFVNISFKDGSYLEIDLIHRFDRKGIIYLDAKEILNHTEETSEGIFITSIKHMFEYVVLFYIINGANIPDRYVQYFASLSVETRREIFGYICFKYKLHLNVLDELFSCSGKEPKKMIEGIKLQPINKNLSRILNTLRYSTDVVRDLIHNRGIIITFSGVDGAGKSTVLEIVRQNLQMNYRQRVVVLRHRPSLLPILSSVKYGKKNAERRTTENLPRQGKNNNSISSFFRFMYYYIDYLLGQFYIYFKYTLRGYTVLYDRYYFDFIIDSKRSNIVLPKSFVRLFYYFLFKPDVNIFLYATPEIILSRKHEMSLADIKTLTAEYRQLFEDLNKSGNKQKYLVINNEILSDTLDIVMKQCISVAL